MVITNILFLIGLGVVLAIGANWVVKGASFIARSLAVKSFLLGFLILGVVTTIPEMFVAYQAVRDGIPQLSVGNLLGGSILLLSFVMGASAMILGRIILNHGMTTRDIIQSSLVVATPAVVLWDGEMTRIEGIVLIVIYMLHVMFVSKEQHVVRTVEQHANHVLHIGHALALFVGGILSIAISSHFIVNIAESLAKTLQVSPFVIGLFLVTLGTNLPELSLVVMAIVKKKRDIAFGDVLGSAVINTPLLGIVCLVAPFSVPDHTRTRATLILLAGTALYFLWAASSKRDITRKEGVGLFILYLMFIGFELLRI